MIRLWETGGHSGPLLTSFYVEPPLNRLSMAVSTEYVGNETVQPALLRLLSSQADMLQVTAQQFQQLFPGLARQSATVLARTRTGQPTTKRMRRCQGPTKKKEGRQTPATKEGTTPKRPDPDSGFPTPRIKRSANSRLPKRGA